MPLLVQKTMAELMAGAMARLDKTPISETGPGGIARLLLAVFNEQLAADRSDGLYGALTTAHAQAFLSTAQGVYLDMIGELLACRRNPDEGDSDYKFRISKQALTLAAANETAVRLAALSVPGVKDVTLKPYTHGTGSGSLYIVTDDPSQGPLVLTQVQSAVDEVKAFGIRISVFSPILLPVETYVRLIFDKAAAEMDQTLIRARATQALKDYINSRAPGQGLAVNEIVQRVMAVSDLVFDVEVVRLVIAGRPSLVTNQSCSWNERFVESSRPKAVLAA